MSGVNILKTKTGRRYFTVDMDFLGVGSFTNGYIEIDDDAPVNYMDPYYEKFNMWFDPSYSGLIFTKIKVKGGIPLSLSSATPEMLNSNKCLKKDLSNLEERLKSVKPEYKSIIKDAIEKGDYFWVVGFDDNHIDRLGRSGVIEMTKRVAEQMDRENLSRTSQKTLSEDTQKLVDKATKGKDVSHYDNEEAFFEDLGISDNDPQFTFLKYTNFPINSIININGNEYKATRVTEDKDKHIVSILVDKIRDDTPSKEDALEDGLNLIKKQCNKLDELLKSPNYPEDPREVLKNFNETIRTITNNSL